MVTPPRHHRSHAPLESGVHSDEDSSDEDDDDDFWM
jgi:hypothetical protein